jgi:hypothetical protein
MGKITIARRSCDEAAAGVRAVQAGERVGGVGRARRGWSSRAMHGSAPA